jgi:GTP-binding protein
VNFFRVADELYLADLPGYGYAKVPEAMRMEWESLAVAYLVGRKNIALCVFLVDLRHEPQPGDLTMRTFLDHHELPYVIAATKADKMGRGAAEQKRRALEAGLGNTSLGVFAVSSETRAGVPELWKTLRAAALAHGA